MKKKTWDLYAPIYERAMRADRKVYAFMYERIPTVIHGKEVREIDRVLRPGGILIAPNKEMAARITLMYAESARKEEKA